VTSGRKRSIGILVLHIVFALIYQYALPSRILDLPIDQVLKEAWTDGCDNGHWQEACLGRAGNLRVLCCTIIFFVLAAVAAALQPTANRLAWPAKYVLYILGVAGFLFVPTNPLITPITLTLGRIGGAFFIVAQQLHLVDMAYNWNNAWVEKHNQAEVEEMGSGKKWLTAILIACGVLECMTLASWIYIGLRYTNDCPLNLVFLIITILAVILIHAAQLSGEQGSLLASSMIGTWLSYLCYNAVSKHPDCGTQDDTELRIALGLIVTFLSLGYTGWAVTSTKMLTNNNHDVAAADEEQQPNQVTGVVTGDYGATINGNEENIEEAKTEEDAPMPPGSWRINLVLATVACWTSMTLTGWGELTNDGLSANPSAGTTAMWMVMAAQWLCILLYLWMLVAPRLFPDREFDF